MREPLDVFVVETSFRLPGLGVIALPVAPPPVWLATYALHTALAITVLMEGEPPQSITGTVEELVQDEVSRRGLLLDFNPSSQLPTGSCLQAYEVVTEVF